MRKTKEEAEYTRQLLLKTAVKVFGEKGYAATRLSDIAEEANVTRGAIYWHFGNKKELFLELIRDRIKPFFNLIDGILNSDLSPIQKIRKIMLDVGEKVVADEEFKANQQLEFIKTTMLGEIQEIEDFIDEKIADFEKLLLNLFEEGRRRGEIRTDVATEDILSVLYIFMRGAAFLLAHGKDSALRERLPSVVDLIVSSFKTA